MSRGQRRASAQHQLLNSADTRISESMCRICADTGIPTLGISPFPVLDSSWVCSQHSFQFLACRWESFPLPSGQCRVSKIISRIRSVLTNARMDVAFPPPGSNAKRVQIPGDVAQCEARRWSECPLFLRSTRGRWTPSTSLRLIFRPLSASVRETVGYQRRRWKQWKNRWELQKKEEKPTQRYMRRRKTPPDAIDALILPMDSQIIEQSHRKVRE